MKPLEIVLMWILMGSMPRMLGGAVMTSSEPKCAANFTADVDRDVCRPEERYKHTGLEADLASVKDLFIWPLAHLVEYVREATQRRRDNILVLGEVHSLSNKYRHRRLRDLRHERSATMKAVRFINDLNNQRAEADALIGNLTLNIRPLLQGPLVERPRLDLVPEGHIIKLHPQPLLAKENMTFFR